VVWCCVVWCGVVWCGMVWCGVVWCGVVIQQHSVPRDRVIKQPHKKCDRSCPKCKTHLILCCYGIRKQHIETYSVCMYVYLYESLYVYSTVQCNAMNELQPGILRTNDQRTDRQTDRHDIPRIPAKAPQIQAKGASK
jgi:hypothetical protein